MKQNILVLVCLSVTVTSLFGQVKQTYQDNTYSQTTVVIKEDGVNDLDILNSQFDLDEIGMDQVIRITTGGTMELDTPTAKKEAAVSLHTISKTSLKSPGKTAPAKKMTRWKVRDKKEILVAPTAPVKVETKPVTVAAPVTRTSVSKRTSSIKKQRTIKSKKHRKIKKKRLKLKKRKRARSRNYSRCYHF